MAEKLDELRQGAKRRTSRPVDKEPFIPGIVEDETPISAPVTPTTAEKPRMVMGTGAPAPKRKAANFDALKGNEPKDENIKESPQKEILKPGGIFDQYIEEKKKEMETYLEDKTFSDDEIEQTPDEEYQDAEVAADDGLDEEERELEEMYEDDDFEETLEEDYSDSETMEDMDMWEPEDDLVLPEIESEETEDQEDRNVDEVESVDDTALVEEEENIPDPTISKYTIDVDEDKVKEEDDLGELIEASDDEEDEELMNDLKAQITKVIRPAAAKLDLSSFTIINNPKGSASSKPIAPVKRSVAKWVLPNTGIVVEMSELGGSEIEYLRENNGRDATSVRNSLKVFYDHLVTPKPQSFETWLKSVAYSDHDHLFMCGYISGFSDSNYVPYTCDNQKCKNMFLSANIPIMDMVHFKNAETKKKFNDLYNSGRVNPKGLYASEVIAISPNYAVSLVVPSLYSVYFESSGFSQSFAQKYNRAIGFVPYIDAFYEIDMENHALKKVKYQTFANNPGKTAKSKVICYSKIIDSLSTDEYSNLLALANAIDERADWFNYRIPETECPKCKTKIKAVEDISARELVFTRHRLGLLANTSIK